MYCLNNGSIVWPRGWSSSIECLHYDTQDMDSTRFVVLQRCWKICHYCETLFRLKNMGGSFRSYLAQYMDAFRCHSYYADPVLWTKPETRPEDYYLHILWYANVIHCIYYSPDDIFNKLNDYIPLKSGSISSSNMYLCTKLKFMQLHNVVWALSMS